MNSAQSKPVENPAYDKVEKYSVEIQEKLYEHILKQLNHIVDYASGKIDHLNLDHTLICTTISVFGCVLKTIIQQGKTEEIKGEKYKEFIIAAIKGDLEEKE